MVLPSPHIGAASEWREPCNREPRRPSQRAINLAWVLPAYLGLATPPCLEFHRNAEVTVVSLSYDRARYIRLVNPLHDDDNGIILQVVQAVLNRLLKPSNRL